MMTVRQDTMPDNAINERPVKEALKEMGIHAPVGEIIGQPVTGFKEYQKRKNQ
jgi:hypothetical protein